MQKVFVVQHIRPQDGGGDDVKMIGAFASRVSADSAVSELITRAGFKALPNGFSIDEYEIDQIHWKEGFGSD
jgi:hypothetical protein